MKKLTLTVTEFRKNIFKMLEKIEKESITITLTYHGKPKWVIMSGDEYEGLMETLDILSNEELMKDLREAEENMKKGRGIPFEQVLKELNITEDDLSA